MPEDNAMKPKQPPACTFPLAQTTTAETTPQEYTFSEPQVVLTASEDEAAISIIEWLPDNQRVLIMQEFRSNAEQNIELFNPQTGERQVYATRHASNKRPKWLPELDAVIYPALNIFNEDKVNHRFEFTRQILTSQGDPKNPHLVEDNLSDSVVGVNPDNGQIVSLSNKHISKRKASLETLPSVAFDSNRWNYHPMGMGVAPSYDMTWRPGSSQIFLYSDGNTGGYTFLLDTDTGDVCELNFDGWAGIGRWSSDGRYLAITRATESIPINSSDLAVLDTVTGNIYAMQLAPQEMIGQHYVEDLVWAPDDIHLVAIGSVMPFPPTGRLYDKDKFSGLYLVDFISGQSVHLLPENKFFAGWPGTNLAWSPDGLKLLIRCPANDHSRLCLIPVQRIGK
jgi:dipeptidyl aminopeptidase/acylaminoacyl peptidase